MELSARRRRTDAGVAVRADVDRAGRRTRADAEGQSRTAGQVADEEVRFVARDVPGLGGEAAPVGLLEAHGRRVRSGQVEIETGRALLEADVAGAVDVKRVRRSARFDRHRNSRSRGVFDGELVRAT